jgi:hypothetical protein
MENYRPRDNMRHQRNRTRYPLCNASLWYGQRQVCIIRQININNENKFPSGA